MVILQYYQKLSWQKKIIGYFLVGMLLELLLCKWIVSDYGLALNQQYQLYQAELQKERKLHDLLDRAGAIKKQWLAMDKIYQIPDEKLFDKLLNAHQLNKLSYDKEAEIIKFSLQGNYQNIRQFLLELAKNWPYAWQNLTLSLTENGNLVLNVSMLSQMPAQKITALPSFKNQQNPFSITTDQELLNAINLYEINWLGTLCDETHCVASILLPNKNTWTLRQEDVITKERWRVKEIIINKVVLERDGERREIGIGDKFISM